MELRPITGENLRQILELQVLPGQESFVASNRESLQDAARAGKNALPLGLYHEGVPVGFALVSLGEAGQDQCPEAARDGYCLWRLMLDARYQGQGLGNAAMEAILSYLRTRPLGPARLCWLSCEPENRRARALYRRFGFRETGELCEGELVSVLTL